MATTSTLSARDLAPIARDRTYTTTTPKLLVNLKAFARSHQQTVIEYSVITLVTVALFAGLFAAVAVLPGGVI